MANIALNENTQLNLDMEAMTVNTEGHCDEWNIRHKQLLENDQYLNKQLQEVENTAKIGAKVVITDDDTTPPDDHSVLWVHG